MFRKTKKMEDRIQFLEFENYALNKKLREITEWREKPNWSKSITVSPYIFEKYIEPNGTPRIGSFNWRGYDVRVDEKMSNGYIRYEEAIEEPHDNCITCKVNFKLVTGYPNTHPKFCSYKCYEEKINQ